jgi:hypothetical protein
LEATDTGKSGFKHRTKVALTVAIAVSLIALAGVGGFIVWGTTVHAPTVCSQATTTGSGLGATDSSCVTMTVKIVHQEQRFVDLKLITEGFTASCWAFCSNGITYTLDPTVLITNNGHDFEQCKIFGSAGTITCTAADTADVIMLSSSASTPAATDTSCAGGITSGGLMDALGTVTPSAAGSTVTTTISHTFTAGETDSNVQLSCLMTELHNGANPVDYAEGTFGPDTLVSGNTLTITWTISRT